MGDIDCRIATLADTPGIWKLCTRSFAAYRRCPYEDFHELCLYRWRDNPARTDDDVFGWVLEDRQREIVGFLGLVPVRVKIGDGVHVGVAPTSWAVAPECRSSSLYLYGQLMSWSATRLLLNTTATAITAAVHASLPCGVTQIPLSDFDQRLLWVLDYHALFSWKIGQLAANNRTLSILNRPSALRLMVRPARVLLRLKLAIDARRPLTLRDQEIGPQTPHLSIAPIERFTPEFDRFWDDIGQNYGITVERRAAFLNWRHRDAPRWLGRSVAFACSEQGKLSGYVTVRQPVNTAPGHCLVTDLFYDQRRIDVLHALMRAAFAHAKASRGSVLELSGFHPAVYDALRTFEPYVVRRNSLEVLGRTASSTAFLRALTSAKKTAPAATYWYRAPTKALADVCATQSWWPSGIDGDLNL